MKRIISSFIVSLLIVSQSFAFGLWDSASLGFGNPAGFSIPGQTAFYGYNETLSGGTFARASSAWNPETGALVTTNVPRYVTGKTGQAILIEEASTNVFLNSQGTAAVTQNIAVTTANSGKWTTSVFGAGTVTTSAGTATATGYGVATTTNPNTITVTGNGTVTFTVAGATASTIINVENLPHKTSPIVTGATTITRAAETLAYPTAGVLTQDTAATIQGWWQPEGVSAGKVQTIWSTYTGAADYTAVKYNGVILYAEKAKTGQVTEYVTIAATVAAGSWNQFALVINTDGTMSLYHNGVADAKTSGADADGLSTQLLADPTLDNAGSWTTNITISGGNASWSNQSTNYAISQVSKATTYKLYQLVYDITAIPAGQLQPWWGLGLVTTSPTVNNAGVKTVTAFALGTSIGVTGYTPTTATVASFNAYEIYNTTSAVFTPVIASTMQMGAYNSTLQVNSYLDNYRFFSRPLTAAEILKSYNLGR